MIRRILDGESLNLYSSAIEAQKINALWRAYSAKYDFCRFYRSECAVICVQECDAVLYVEDEGKCDYDELTEFLLFVGVREVFCSEKTGMCMSEIAVCEAQFVNLMSFDGCAEFAEIECNPPLEEVFEVVRQAFGLSDRLFEWWYLDMSHRIRHRVSDVYRIGGSVLSVEYHGDDGIVISQVATLPMNRNNGNATKLIKAVCARYSGFAIKLLCTDDLARFYEKIGFVNLEKKCNLFPNIKMFSK